MTFRAALGLILLTAWGVELSAQSAGDSARITFRANQPSTPLVFVPGQFNNWGNNSGGVIQPTDPSVMTYDAGLGCWVKTYTFKIHDPGDTRRTLGDSVFQYKFNRGGTSTGWYSDPLNPETNPADNNNSVLRLTRFFWFQYSTSISAFSWIWLFELFSRCIYKYQASGLSRFGINGTKFNTINFATSHYHVLPDRGYKTPNL